MKARSPLAQKGFTIIEVVLVLAIAGLIFLIVFLALPQAQKSRRDTQRRRDVGIVVGNLEHYLGSNGSYPSTQALTDSFKAGYLSSFNDPSTGSAYTITYQTTAPASVGTMSFSRAATCGASGALSATSSTLQVAVSVKLENGFFCQNN
ncbi:MAG TPA: type II secretion system protein [Candidatus Saccharimonadales bacterium]|nr:type II secretion system protein [Candidatus Saccharimonadales bacterium]